MSSAAKRPIPHRHAVGLTRAARGFFLLAVVVLALAGAIARLLAQVGAPSPAERLVFPPVFGVTTLLLASGSFALSRALTWVRRERQRLFRRWLLIGLACGTLFIGMQSYGFWTLFPATRTADEASRGVTAFVLVFTMLHAMHFTIAVLFLVFVTVQAFADRYDHEYHWGVKVCGYFWHALGIVWLAILAVLAITV